MYPQSAKSVMAEGEVSTLSKVDLVECPKCGTQVMIIRSRIPVIDSSGFEVYRLQCDGCEGLLVGVIDPFDNKLLISEMEP